MTPLQTITFRSPIGWLKLTASNSHLHSVYPTTQPTQPSQHTTTNAILNNAIQQLSQYFNKQLSRFNLPLQQQGTPFQQHVWHELQKIPYGQTISYQTLAARIGQPKASRAVASAIAKNKLLILIPCHRVILSNGQLGGYACGTPLKRLLLQLEQMRPNLP